jgi:hypothetical protein
MELLESAAENPIGISPYGSLANFHEAPYQQHHREINYHHG